MAALSVVWLPERGDCAGRAWGCPGRGEGRGVRRRCGYGLVLGPGTVNSELTRDGGTRTPSFGNPQGVDEGFPKIIVANKTLHDTPSAALAPDRRTVECGSLRTVSRRGWCWSG